MNKAESAIVARWYKAYMNKMNHDCDDCMAEYHSALKAMLELGKKESKRRRSASPTRAQH